MEIVIRRLRTEELKRPLLLVGAASKAGLAPSTLSDYERGRSEPVPSILEQIAEGFGCYIEDLYDSPQSHPFIIQYKRDRRRQAEEAKRILAEIAHTAKV